MPAIDSLLKRFGFVRLTRYGLVLTPEGRIMSLRPEILDDGMGGKIVGWQDRDLASAELSKWEPARPAPVRAVASRVATSPVPPIVRIPPRPAPVVAPALVLVEDEDEWEWEIALARARTAAAEVEVAAARTPPPMPVPRRTRQDTVPPPPRFIAVTTEPLARIAGDTGEWTATEPVVAIDYNDYTNPTTEIVRAPAPPPRPTPIPVRTVPRAPTAPVRALPPASPPMAAPPRTIPRAPSPTTVIPVPKLPRITATHQIQPVVSTPRRLAKGTAPQERPHLGVTPPPPIRPADDDRTSPGIAIPRPALPRLPGLKRASSAPGR